MELIKTFYSFEKTKESVGFLFLYFFIEHKVRDFSCPAPLGWMKSKVKQSPVGLWFADKRNPELEIKALARGERSSTGKQGFYFTYHAL